jgi:hypothetical protein
MEKWIGTNTKRFWLFCISLLVAVSRFAITKLGLEHLAPMTDETRLGKRLRNREEEEPYLPGVTPLYRLLMPPAIIGFLASVAIFAGASFQNSPFTLKIPGSWYFGIPAPSPIQGTMAPPGQGLFIGVVMVYGGMLILIRAWYDIVKIVSRHPGVPVSRLVPIFVAWMLPMLVVAPLFSRDMYSYAAQGEMMSHHISPYRYGTATLGQGPFTTSVDKLWQYVPSPYGPVFLTVDAWIVEATGHNMLASVEGLRLLALLGVTLFGFAIPIIAKTFGRDGAVSFSLAVLNPLIILHLIGGGHNDALMLGLLAVGYALARKGHPIWGVFVCGVAGAVKVPAIIGSLYIGWEYLGPKKSVKERILPVFGALALTTVVIAASAAVVGLGWGWIGGLSNPDTVRSWLDPATGIAIYGAKFIALLGLGNHVSIFLTIARGGGLALAAVLCYRLLLKSEEVGSLWAMGWSMLLVVVLSPVVQPWYASWGFVFLAPVAVGATRKMIVILSAISCYVGLPGGRVLLHEITIANPWLVATTSFALVVIFVLILLPRFAVSYKPRAEIGGRFDMESLEEDNSDTDLGTAREKAIF